MTETREPFLTDSEAYGGPLFQVELIDSKGKSHGFIGYRFHAPGAQAAADGWNNQRERFDLVAVIKPFEEPKPEAKPQPNRIASEAVPRGGSMLKDLIVHKRLLLKSLKACVKAIDGLPPYYMTSQLDRARELGHHVLNQLE